ncbi:hypothetical protein ACH5RR_028251 [Cinchona calisaya]|uniref:Integrase catalytic domain-containing protein n=1 Tax=Cinchona calisaya TaxID=153742 RepID=A0ABD2YN94_9GENT
MTFDDTWLWHLRFGHLNFESLKFLTRKILVIGLSSINYPNKKCEFCILRQKHKDPFPKDKAWRAKKPLQLIHSDFCLVEVTSNGGSKYFITFIDDFSRKTWVYFLKNKSDACDVFKKFKYYLEKQSGYFIKILRTDWGTEFLLCDDFLKKYGFKHQLTVRYTPQQNSVVERKKRTVMDIVRSMIHSKNMPKSFWAEAVSCAIYVLNGCPTICNYGQTPYEIWIGKKSHISHLKIFGCLAYAHVPDVLKKKLDDKAKKIFFFFWYSHETKGYKLFNPDTGKVIISRDITFDE